MGFNIWPAISYAVEKLPLQRLFDRPRDRKKEMTELYDILKGDAQCKPKPLPAAAIEQPAESEEPEGPVIEIAKPRVHLEKHPESTSTVSTAETVAYQNREIGKVLIQMQRHASQGFLIAGKPCDCGTKHLPDLEGLAEETLSMVSNPEIYSKVLQYVKDVGPKVTIEAITSGVYKAEYPSFSTRARELRKELMGTDDIHVLFQHTTLSKEEPKEDARATTILPTENS